MLATMKVAAALMVWSLPFLVVQSPVTVESGQAAASMTQEGYSCTTESSRTNFLPRRSS